MWYDKILDELSYRGIGVILGLLAGALIAWFFASWKRMKERRSIARGDARDTIVLHHHLIEATAEGLPVLRIRSVGQAELSRVVPNGHLASELHSRATRVTPRDTLISMEGAEGSYLLETLTNFVCDRVCNGPFEHHLFVMAPCCEPAELSLHQPITILLIGVHDLLRFEHWNEIRDVQVEHGSDGARVLTLMELARRFRKEQQEFARRRQTGEKTKHLETMYILDLALDKRTAPLKVKPIPWERYDSVLKQLILE